MPTANYSPSPNEFSDLPTSLYYILYMQKYIVSCEISNGLRLIENKQKKEANGGKLKIKSKDFAF